MTQYSKFAAAVVATVLSAISAALFGDGVISATEWVNVAIAGVGAAAVFAAPNVPGAAYTKSVLAVLTAVLTVLASAIVGGISTEEWIQILLAGLGAVGVYSVTNKQ
jgi:2-keto-3-deoxy-6-phosphogluconate aldolase